jgi:hypothetical protein
MNANICTDAAAYEAEWDRYEATVASHVDTICDNLGRGRAADYGMPASAELGAAIRQVYAECDDFSGPQLSALRSAATRAGVTLTDL